MGAFLSLEGFSLIREGNIMSRFSFRFAGLLAAALLGLSAASFARQPEVAKTADLTGKYQLTGGGYLVVSVDDAGRVEGFFERNGQFGRISGRADAGVISAKWVQENGANPCESKVDNSVYWGRLTLTRAEDGQVQTAWGVCQAQPTPAE
jgi:hypothetical protein